MTIEDRGGRARAALPAAGIVGIALAINLAGNGRVGLWDRDEPRYAACAREMRERGDWIRPTFNGEPRYHKPVLIYWLMRGGMAVGGDNPFGARLASALAGAGTCLAAWALGRAMAGPGAGLVAGLAMATAPLSVAESKLATTDATLALLVTLAQACLWGLARGESRRLARGFWASMALATLVKGPIGPVFVAAGGVASWWLGGPTACWRRLRWREGMILFGGLVLPWYVAVGIASRGEFYRFAVGTQIVQRVSTGLEQHGGFPGYYAALVLPLFYPWSALAIPALAWAWRRRREVPDLAFLLGWAIGPWLVLECFGTKLVHYYLPALPALAILAGRFAAAVAEAGGDLRAWPLGRLGVRLVGAIGFGVAAILAAGAMIGPRPLMAPCLAMAGALAIGTAWSRAGLARGRMLPASVGLGATWAVVMGLFAAWLLPAAEPYRLSSQVGGRLAEMSGRSGVRPAIMNYQEPSLVYNFGRPVLDVHGPDDLAAEVARRGPVLMPLMASDLASMRPDGRFRLRTIGTASGYDVNKGKRRTLEFVVVEAAPAASVAASAAGQESLVK